MNKFKWIVIFIVIFFAAGECLAGDPSLIPISESMGRISGVGISILPPEGEDWYLMQNLPQGGVFFTKSLAGASHTLVFSLTVIPTNQNFDTRDTFLAFVKEQQESNMSGKRFKDLKSNYELSERFSPLSVEYQIRARDTQRKANSGMPMIMKMHGHTFVHPHNPGYIVDVVYSERGEREGFTPLFEAVGEKFIASLVAEDNFETISTEIPQSAEAVNASHAERGGHYIQQGQYSMAISEYKKALREDPTNAVYLYNIGHSYVRLNKFKEAIKYFNKAVLGNPNDGDTYRGMGFCYDQLGQYSRAIEYYKKALGIDPHDSGMYYNIGVAYVFLKRYDYAIENYKKALELNPSHSSSYNNMGYIYTQLGKHEQALGYYEQALQLDPSDPFCYNNIGFSYYNLGQYEKAIQYYQDALRIKRDYIEARNNLEAAYRKLRK